MVPKSHFAEISEALICGKRLTSVNLRSTLASTGLIHIFVVSGLHLNLISRCFKFATLPIYLEFTLLFLYALVSGANPPVVRALTQKVVSEFRKRFEMHWPDDLVVWHSSFLTLILASAWIESFSFLLSWSALLGLAMFNKSKSPLVQYMGVYLVMFPVLNQISNPHPTTIFITLTLGTLIGTFIFPVVLFSILLSPLTYVLDMFWSLTLSLLTHLAKELPSIPPNKLDSKWPIITYLLLAHLLVIVNRVIKTKETLQKGTTKP